jgi:hypothetical protein
MGMGRETDMQITGIQRVSRQRDGQTFGNLFIFFSILFLIVFPANGNLTIVRYLHKKKTAAFSNGII